MTALRLLAITVVVAALCRNVVSAQDATGSTLTSSEYDAVLEQVLPCPTTEIRETRDFQLCLLIVPPGHRFDERELLAVFTFRGGSMDMVLKEPEFPLGRYAGKMKAAGAECCNSFQNLRFRVFRTTDPKKVARVIGRSWAKLQTELVPQNDWFMDATEYRIRAETMTGRLLLDVPGPGPSVRRQPSAVLEWAERVRKEAARIVADQPPIAFVRDGH